MLLGHESVPEDVPAHTPPLKGAFPPSVSEHDGTVVVVVDDVVEVAVVDVVDVLVLAIENALEVVT